MGFSKTPVEKIDEAAELLTAIKILVNKDALEQAVKEAHALSADEAAKAKEARNLIGHYESLIAEHQKKKNALDAFHESLLADQKTHQNTIAADNAAIEAKKAENDKVLNSIKDNNTWLDERNKKLNEQAAKNESDRKELIELKNNLETGRANLEKDRIAIAALKQEAEALMAKAKEKIALVNTALERL